LTFSRATQQRVYQAGHATNTAPDIVSANPNAAVVATAKRTAEQILCCVDNSLHAGRSDTRVSRHGPIPAPQNGPPGNGRRRGRKLVLSARFAVGAD
jgi:hypothetical protein